MSYVPKVQGGIAAESLRQTDGDAEMLLRVILPAAGRRSSLEGLLFLVVFTKEGKELC